MTLELEVDKPHPAHVVEGIDLCTIEKPFGLLPNAAQDALKEWPHGVEFYTTKGWVKSAPIWNASTTYRAMPAPTEQPLVVHDWDVLADWVQWVAQDDDGGIYGYDGEPDSDVDLDIWGYAGRMCDLYGLSTKIITPSTGDWTKAKVQRPVGPANAEGKKS